MDRQRKAEHGGGVGSSQSREASPSKSALPQLHLYDVGGDSASNLSQSDILMYKDAFSFFDKAGEGSISKNKLAMVMRAMGEEPTDQSIQEMINEVDADGTGEIDFSEFLTMMTSSHHIDMDEEMKQAFRVFDKDGDGFISASELKEVMKSLEEKLTDDEIKEMLTEADTDGDGKIGFNEFVQMMNEKC